MILGGIVIGWIHLMAAVVVIGGSFFINVVLSRATENWPPPEVGKVNQAIGPAFGPVSWICVILLILTGVMRAAFLGAFDPDVLFGSVYGNLLLGKAVLLVIVIFNLVVITRTGLEMEKLSKEGPPPPEKAAAAGAKIKRLGTMSMILGMIIIFLAVAMRFVGLPE